AAAMMAISILKLRRNSVRAIAVMLSGSLILAGLLIFQEWLPAIVRPFVSDDLYTLNSRTDLWAQTLSYIAAQPILGTGYFASRYVLIKDFSWAGHAHNSFLEVLLTTGLVGLALLAAFLILTFKEILTTRNAWLLGVTLYCVIQGMLNPVLFNPGLAMFALAVALLYREIKKSSASPATVSS
ncbi:MAG TPA: O-antigen ligase family protein, partial [Pyrinomonadaceae bacterium]